MYGNMEEGQKKHDREIGAMAVRFALTISFTNYIVNQLFLL